MPRFKSILIFYNAAVGNIQIKIEFLCYIAGIEWGEKGGGGTVDLTEGENSRFDSRIWIIHFN